MSQTQTSPAALEIAQLKTELEAWKAQSRKWERRCRENRAHARKWEQRSKGNKAELDALLEYVE